MLAVLAIVTALGWESWAAVEAKKGLAGLEALGLAWDDRCWLLGAPVKAKIPLPKMLSPAYAGGRQPGHSDSKRSRHSG